MASLETTGGQGDRGTGGQGLVNSQSPIPRFTIPQSPNFLVSLLFLLALLFTLSGCLLASGEALTIDQQGGSGNLSAEFVSAEGLEERFLQTASPNSALQVIVIASVETGDLGVELLDPNGSVVFSVVARAGAQVTRSGLVPTDSEGRLRYRLNAFGARGGNYQILFLPGAG
jgi:hypothetical protein